MAILERVILKFHRLRFQFLYPKTYKKGSVHGPFSIIHPNKLHFGERFSLNDYCYLNATNGIRVGNNVAISAGAKIISLKLNFTKDSNNSTKLVHIGSEITIGNNVQIGANATILPNVSICDNVIIGAGAVVSKSILEPGIYVGIPVKKIHA
ncbi:acyltransferase [Tenacibaculum piscium]|uniref:acyltransferase n=1 Tax=Tenacibaculum piscium TaxID=1458515 RepID=UPI001F358167|nr:acyltransferase [Tenacibaculum piscium]